MSLRDLVIQFKEKGFDSVNKKIDTVNKKTLSPKIKTTPFNKFNDKIGLIKNNLGKLSGMNIGVGGLNTSIGALTGGLTSIATSSAGAVAGIVLLTNKIFNLTKAWSKNTEAMYLNSKRSGLAVRDFQILSQAGKEYNFTQEDVITAMTKLRGVMVKNKDTRNTSVAFKDIADKIKNAKTQTEALVIAEENFGRRSGGKLVEFLKTGADGFEAMAKSMGKGIISDSAIQNMIAFQDKMNTIQKQMDGIKNWFFSNIIFAMGELGKSAWEAIQPLMDGIMSILAPIMNIIATVGNILFTNIIPATSIIGTTLKFIGTIIDIIYTGWSMIIASIYKAIDAVVEWLDKLMGVKKWFDKLKNSTFGQFITYLVGGETNDGRTIAGDLEKQREELGLEGYRKGEIKDKTPVQDVLDNMDNFKKPTIKGSSSTVAQPDALLTQVIMFKNQFILFANQLLGLQRAGSVGQVKAGSIIGSGQQTNNISVTVTGGTNNNETGQAVADAIVKELAKINSSNNQIIKSIASHEQTVKTVTGGGKSAQVTPAPTPQPSPVGV